MTSKIKKKKELSTKLMVKRALKNGPKWKPSKGNVYLENLEPGNSFMIGNTKGILIETNESRSQVLIISASCAESDKNYYLGKQTWALKTEVKKGNNNE